VRAKLARSREPSQSVSPAQCCKYVLRQCRNSSTFSGVRLIQIVIERERESKRERFGNQFYLAAGQICIYFSIYIYIDIFIMFTAFWMAPPGLPAVRVEEVLGAGRSPSGASAASTAPCLRPRCSDDPRTVTKATTCCTQTPKKLNIIHTILSN
jgi:hypothetical protein